MTKPKSSHLQTSLLTAAAVLVAALVLFYFDPRQSAFYPQCPFHAMTGWHCPGCGALRGLHELVHGRVLAALGMNPLVFIGLPLLVGVYGWQRFRDRERGTRSTFLQRPLTGWLLLTALLLFWILRNIPIYPFSLMAP